MCWKRLPLSLNIAQDIFQAKIDQILEGLDGVINIADDVAVYDKNFYNLIIRAAETSLVFNNEKCFVK